MKACTCIHVIDVFVSIY